MEQGYWLKLTVIAALVLGSIYVLMPTFLIDESAALAEQAGGVTTEEAAGSALEVLLDVDGDPQQGAEQLSTRLQALGIDVRQVTVSGGKVDVLMKAGTAREDVLGASLVKAEVSYHTTAPVVLGEPPAAREYPEDVNVATMLAELRTEVALPIAIALGDDIETAERIAGLVGQPVGDLPKFTDMFGTPQDGEIGIAPDLPADQIPPVVLVASDGKFIGVGLPKTVEAGSFLEFLPFDDTNIGTLLGSPLSMTYTLSDDAAAEGPEDAPEDAAAVVATSILPKQIEAMLMKDTRLNLGIDLRGGIDLTLRVNLEEAVITRVNRDRAGLVADIARDFGADSEGEDLELQENFFTSCQKAFLDGGTGEPVDVETAWSSAQIEADRDLPLIRIETELSLAEVQSYLARRLGDYQYVETTNSDNPNKSIHHFEMSDEAQKRIQSESVEQVLETLRRRIDATGVKEPSIVKKGGGAISVQLPGMVDLQSAVDAIGTTAVLEFQLVEHELGAHLSKLGMTPMPLETMIVQAKASMPPEQFADDELLDRWLHDAGLLPNDRMVRWQYIEDPELGDIRMESHTKDGWKPTGAMALKVDPNPLTGSDVNDAGVGWDQAQQAVVTLSFKQRGATKFCEISTPNVGKRFAIMLDGKIMSAPNFQSEICGGRGQITMGNGLDPQKDAQNLALVLRTGSLNAPVNVGEVRIVGSTLGEDSIRAGATATAIGGGLVLLFMGLWYRTAGWVANFALFTNILLVLASLCLFGANLTLPGIAGIALTVGMAVDANIIIYERIREEMRLGQHARKAVDVGFDKAMVAVLDANITTAIAGIVLFSYGTGPIKGFAVTLLIGIITTLVTALFINRTLMELLTRSSTARLKI